MKNKSVEVVAYAEINGIVVGLLKNKYIYDLKFHVSIFRSVTTMEVAQFRDKGISYNKATKRFAKLCKAAQTMTFKTQKTVASE